eukprot:Nk52_evm13s210 gene=Nk52_evmTU13s210
MSSVGNWKGVKASDSESLWNCAALSPGWTMKELEILRKALMRYGLGKWTEIMKSGCLPGKNPNQLNNQTQRLLGQQSTAEFQGIHLDPLKVKEANDKIQGPDVKRKNGCIVNTGNAMSKEEKLTKIEENRKKYEIPEAEYEKIVLVNAAADVQDPLAVLKSKRMELAAAKQELNLIEEAIEAKQKDELAVKVSKGLAGIFKNEKKMVETKKEEPKKETEEEKGKSGDGEDTTAMEVDKENSAPSDSNSDGNAKATKSKTPKSAKKRSQKKKSANGGGDEDEEFVAGPGHSAKKAKTSKTAAANEDDDFESPRAATGGRSKRRASKAASANISFNAAFGGEDFVDIET